jgi:transcriptional regulator with XRE-family HTH domain
MIIGDAIRQKRKEYNYTQQELADKLCISRTTISSWENGRTYPDVSMLIELSEVFEASVDSLLKGDEQMVSLLDKNVRKGKKIKYYLMVLIMLLVVIGTYFTIVQIKKNNLYEYVKKWDKVGRYYSCSEGDMVYMTGYIDSIDIRNIPNQLSLVADRSNDNNSQVSMSYNGDDSNIQVTFQSGPIEGMTFIFDNEKFVLEDEVKDGNHKKYSYEIRKSVNTQLNKEHEYLQNTFTKVKNKWKEINGI